MIETLGDLQSFLLKIGHSRGKLKEDVKNLTVEVAVNGWIEAATVITINENRRLGVRFVYRNLSWWECRLKAWVIK